MIRQGTGGAKGRQSHIVYSMTDHSVLVGNLDFWSRRRPELNYLEFDHSVKGIIK